MIAAVVNSQNCWLLPYSPNTDKKVRLGVTLPVDDQRALVGISSRRPQAVLLRYSLEWTAEILAADFAALRNASLAAQDEPILVPLWPHAIRVGIDTATFTAGLTVAWTANWATWAINPGSLTGYDYAAPLLFGRLKQPPRLAAKSGELVTAELSVDEDAPAAYALAPASGVLAADTTFSTAAGFAAPIFPFVPEWSTAPAPGTAVVNVERTATGPGRQKATTFYPQSPEQIHQASFKLATPAAAAALIEWYRRRAAITDPQWVATSQTLGRLSANVTATDTVLHFKTLVPLGGTAYVALFDPAGLQEIGRISSSASLQITLAAGVANAWAAPWTNIAPAILARLTIKELVLQYSPAGNAWLATSTLTWREVSAEYTVPSGETRGTTLGRLPGAAWFFQIDLDYNGAIVPTYLTNWEGGATANAHTWAYNPCDFDKLIKSRDLEDDSCTFSMRWYAGCPWENWQPGVLAARGYLTISRADVDPAGAFSNFRTVFTGELSTPTSEGPNLTVKILGANALFARTGPRQVMSTTCGTQLFSTRCGLALGDWTFNAVIVSVAANVVTIGTITRAIGGGLPSGFGAADWFALGWLGWTASGLPQREGVLTSALLSGGQIVLTLDRACPLAPGASVTVVPGCDRQFTTCSGKFANSDNFRGFPFMPAISPSFIIPQQDVTSAKK